LASDRVKIKGEDRYRGHAEGQPDRIVSLCTTDIYHLPILTFDDSRDNIVQLRLVASEEFGQDTIPEQSLPLR